MAISELSYNDLFQGLSERLISIARLVLAGFFLLAVVLDPSEPAVYASITHGILLGYFLYSLVLVFLVRRHRSVRGRRPAVYHAVDLAIFAVVMYFSQGALSPFFVYFVFLLVCATVRWQWKGTFWTALAAVSIVLLLSWGKASANSPPFEWNRFVIRISYLVVVASLLGYLGRHEQKMRQMLMRLADWPRSAAADVEALARETLLHAAGIMAAPRMLLVWEEEEEPWLHVALLSGGVVDYRRERPAAFGEFVDGRLAQEGFYSPDLRDSHPLVVRSSGESERWEEGNPLAEEFRERFGVTSVVCFPLDGEQFNGYLLALDIPRVSPDDLMLGTIVANEISIRFEQHFLLRELQSAAAMKERVRLVHDLHDGLLQSLTVAALRLETGQRLIESDPKAARQHVQDIQTLIASEQRALRSQIKEMKQALRSRCGTAVDLAGRLRELAEQLQRHWGVDVRVSGECLEQVVLGELSQEIYFIVHESLINAARHSGATTVHAALAVSDGRLAISVADNGRGFPFRGRHDHGTLERLNLGPLSLRARTVALGGELTVDSREEGSTIEILVPLGTPGEKPCRYD